MKKEFIVKIHNDIDKETYTYIIWATNIFTAENTAVAMHIRGGGYITRVETTEKQPLRAERLFLFFFWRAASGRSGASFCIIADPGIFVK